MSQSAVSYLIEGCRWISWRLQRKNVSRKKHFIQLRKFSRFCCMALEKVTRKLISSTSKSSYQALQAALSLFTKVETKLKKVFMRLSSYLRNSKVDERSNNNSPAAAFIERNPSLIDQEASFAGFFRLGAQRRSLLIKMAVHKRLLNQTWKPVSSPEERTMSLSASAFHDGAIQKNLAFYHAVKNSAWSKLSSMFTKISTQIKF